jgi:thioredoxin 1
MAVKHTTQDTFQKDVAEHKGLVLVDYYAEWCGPCKMTSPIIEELAEEIKTMKFVKVDVDANQDLVSEQSIFSIPTFMIYKDGKVVSQFVGGRSKEDFLAEINKVK